MVEHHLHLGCPPRPRHSHLLPMPRSHKARLECTPVIPVRHCRRCDTVLPSAEPVIPQGAMPFVCACTVACRKPDDAVSRMSDVSSTPLYNKTAVPGVEARVRNATQALGLLHCATPLRWRKKEKAAASRTQATCQRTDGTESHIPILPIGDVERRATPPISSLYLESRTASQNAQGRCQLVAALEIFLK